MRPADLIPGFGIVQRDASAATVLVPGAGIIQFATQTFGIHDFPRDMIFQRSGNARTMMFSGNYGSAAPTSVQVRVDSAVTGGTVQAYSTLGNFVASGGIWSGTLSVPSSGASNIGWYRAKAKHSDGTESSLQATQWSIGRRYLFVGESNTLYLWARVSSSLSPNTYCRYWISYTTALLGTVYSSEWAHINVGVTGGPRGLNAFALRLRELMLEANPSSQETIAMVNVGVPGVTIAGLVDGQSTWEWIQDTFGIGNHKVGYEFEAVLFQQGGNGAVSGYSANLDTVISQLRNLTGASVGITPIGTISPDFLSDLGAYTIRNAHYAKSQTTGCFLAGQAIDFLMTDFGHYIPETQYERWGKRLAVAVADQGGISAYGANGPAINAARWEVGQNKIILTITHNSGGSTILDGTGTGGSGLDLEGFQITSSGGQVPTDFTISNGRIEITMSATRGANDTVTLRYAEGANPFGMPFDGTGNDNDIVYDNQSSFLTDTTGFPLLSTFGTPITVSAGWTPQGEAAATWVNQ